MEILLVIAFLAIIFSFSFVAINQAKRTLLSKEQIEIIQLLNEASVRARSGLSASDWGVAFFVDPTTSSISSMVLFSGDDYSSRDSGLDLEFSGGQTVIVENISLVNRVGYTGAGNEVIFESFTGDSHQQGYIQIKSGEQVSVIDINSFGVPVLTK
ncbi:hypothetical protein KJ766_03275 [Patescibacteria group bacterium]|nr:hypothetical protein [Patescibacteria group bacterium]